MRISSAVTIIAATLGLALTLQAQGPAEAAAVSPQQIQSWIGRLDSDNYFQRKTATEKLVAAGAAAIDPLTAEVPGSSLELTTRAIYVLRELALSEDINTEEKARAALVTLAAPLGTSAARQAADALAMLAEIRRDRAARDLERLGAKIEINTAQQQNGLQVFPDVRTITIGDNFRGEDDDLRRLKWLTDVQQIVLTGERVTDATIGHLAGMQNLMYVVVKRAKISDASMAHLRGLKKIRLLSVLYSPIGDASVEHLQVHTNAITIKLYGTKVTRGGAEKLRQALGPLAVDIRRGAFLGVGCQQHLLGCQIMIVHPNSSAARAGLQVMDIIVKYNDKKVVHFDGLTELIGGNTAGETIKLVVIRGEQTLEKEIMLGEWE